MPAGQVAAAGTTPRAVAAAPGKQPATGARSQPARTACRPAAFLQRFGLSLPQLSPGSSSSSSSGGLRERPLYRPSEMVQMGPFKASPMGLGTWAWGNQLLWGYDESMDAELQQVFNAAVAAGVNIFDTGDSYGTGRLNGRSELLLGQFVREYPGSQATVDRVKIGTKLAAYPWRLAPQQWVAAARASCRRVGQQQLGLVQLHWSTANYAPLQERLMWDGLVAIYEEGLAEGVGLSNYGPKQLRKIHKHLSARGVPIASAQVQYGLLSRGPQQEEVRELCGELGIAMIAYSPLALGLLTGKYSPGDAAAGRLPGGPRGLLFRQLLPGLGPLLSTLREVAAARRKTPSQVALNWCIARGAVPIPGAKNLAQLQDNLGALGWRLTEAEVAALEAAADRVPKAMVQNIFATA